MDRQPRFDLDYAHEMAPCALPTPRDPVPSQPRALGLTMRLRCLKVLYDLDRESPSGVDVRLASLWPSPTA